MILNCEDVLVVEWLALSVEVCSLLTFPVIITGTG